VWCCLCDPTFSRFSRTPTCDRHRQTDTGPWLVPRMHSIARWKSFAYNFDISSIVDLGVQWVQVLNLVGVQCTPCPHSSDATLCMIGSRATLHTHTHTHTHISSTASVCSVLNWLQRDMHENVKTTVIRWWFVLLDCTRKIMYANSDGAYTRFNVANELECGRRCESDHRCSAADYNIHERSCHLHDARSGYGHAKHNGCCIRIECARKYSR